jgi:adenylate cyclase, class 2
MASASCPALALRNVELKARLDSLDGARAIAARIATQRLEDQHQVDTYFACRNGRLKVREINGQRAELIWYDRPDQTDSKPCHYRRIPVADPAGLKAALTAACGIRVVVEKHREIYLFHNVRIHLDRVVGQGTFLEFEAVLGPELSEAVGHQQVEQMRVQFGLTAGDLVTGSYADL